MVASVADGYMEGGVVMVPLDQEGAMPAAIAPVGMDTPLGRVVEHSATATVFARPRSVSFTVRGKPQPAGSKKGFYNKKAGRVIITDDAAKSRPWKALVSDAAEQTIGSVAPLNGPLYMKLEFVELRPKGHFNTKQELNAVGRRNPYPAKRPDVLKLARAVEDALSTIVYVDDSQIVSEFITKEYGAWEGVRVYVEELTTGGES